MSQTIVTAGQSLVDVAVQELGSVAALFELADAQGLAITDVLTPGAVLAVPTSPGALPDVASYFAGRARRINTGAPLATPTPAAHDFNQTDFNPLDFN